MQKVSYRLPSTHEGPAIYLSITGRCMASSHRILGSRQSRHYLHQRVIVQMRKLRTGGLPKVIQRTSGRAGARIHAAGRASAPSPTTRPSFGAETELAHPHGDTGSGTSEGPQGKGDAVATAALPLFLRCPPSAWHARRSGEAGNPTQGRQQGPAQGAPGSTRRRVT